MGLSRWGKTLPRLQPTSRIDYALWGDAVSHALHASWEGNDFLASSWLGDETWLRIATSYEVTLRTTHGVQSASCPLWGA